MRRDDDLHPPPSVQSRVFIQFPIFLRIISVVLFIFTLIISQKLLSFAHSQTFLAAGVVDYILQNLATAPISDIQLASSITDIPSGYELSTLYTWPGTKKGCLEQTEKYLQSLRGNSNENNNRNLQETSVGTVTLFSSQCDNVIEKQDSRKMYKWLDKYFLIKRNTDFHYKSSGAKCNEGYTSCSDTICVGKEESCPITSLEVQDPDDTDDSDDEVDIKIKRDKKKIPLYNIEVSMGDTPCYSKGTTPERAQFYEILNIRKDCGVYGQDQSITVLGSKPQVDFFKSNSQENLFNVLPGYYGIVQKEKAIFVARQQIERKDSAECQVNIESESFQAHLQLLKNREGILITIRIIEVIIFALTYFIKYEEVFRLLEFYCFIELFLTLLMTPIPYNAFHLRNINDYSFLLENDCLSDAHLSQGLKDFKILVDQDASYLYIIPIFAVLAAILRLIIYRCARRSSLFSTNQNNLNQSGEFQNSHVVPLLDGIYPTLVSVGTSHQRSNPPAVNSLPPPSLEMNLLHSIQTERASSPPMQRNRDHLTTL